MPASVASGAPPPAVSLSFANNFWGKDDAGVGPLLDRMHSAKTTGDELKTFYNTRAAIEEEYARKLLNLARKPLGSSEAGTLRMSLDVVRGEVESMGKAHQNVAQQMKTELDEQLTAFAGGMKERRKIVQNGIERLVKIKNAQTTTVNKARDRFEQDCLKIKGYLAQGHMVMGQEERKNKAKLEKTQIQLSATSNEYEAAVKILEETTGRWNREWKAACDKFQDLEEERIDFMKSSLWSFANIASTVCVSDDASCEKIRLSLEDCDVQKDITSFIKDCGTGQEIPDPPKFINFAREDASDAASEISNEEAYSVAQFQRAINPTLRSSSPQPSTLESHNDPSSDLAAEMGLSGEDTPQGKRWRHDTMPLRTSQDNSRHPSNISRHDYAHQPPTMPGPDEIPNVPHNEYPMDGMTQFCRTDESAQSSAVSSNPRPSSGDDHSEYSNATSFTSQEPSLLGSPTKQLSDLSVNSAPDSDLAKKCSGIFNNRSPFRRKSKSEKDRPTAASRNTWTASASRSSADSTPRHYNKPSRFGASDRQSRSPEPTDPRAKFQLNVGNNVFDVATPDGRGRSSVDMDNQQDESDPIVQALAELKGAAKQSSVRTSADRYAGIATPGPAKPSPRNQNAGGPNGAGSGIASARTPPPSYEQPPVSRLGAPQPAFTSRQMQQTTQKYVEQKQNMFNTPPRAPPSSYTQAAPNTAPQPRPGSRPVSRGPPGSSNSPHSRSTSPVPDRSTSPRPSLNEYGVRPSSPGQNYSSAPPSAARPRAHSGNPANRRSQEMHDGQYGSSPNGSPGHYMPRSRSPQPQYQQQPQQQPQQHPRPRPQPQPQWNRGGPGSRPQSGMSRLHSGMEMQLAQPNDGYGSQRPPRPTSAANGRPVSQYGGGGGGGMVEYRGQPDPHQRTRSRSVASDGRQLSRDGRPVLQFSRAQYMYKAAIPEELSFAKGDVLAVMRYQDDGWWEAEVCNKPSGVGLVPSNYLVNC